MKKIEYLPTFGIQIGSCTNGQLAIRLALEEGKFSSWYGIPASQVEGMIDQLRLGVQDIGNFTQRN